LGSSSHNKTQVKFSDEKGGDGKGKNNWEVSRHSPSVDLASNPAQ
jgi:hypothetical protein